MIPYTTRLQEVKKGKHGRAHVLVAAFPLAAGGEAMIQLADAPGLPRGGVYLLAPGETAAVAPRFDELFLDLGAKGRTPAVREKVARLLDRARTIARAARAQPGPDELGKIVAFARTAARLDSAHARRGTAPPGLPFEALLVSFLLVFVSEEERYPRPRYSGADLALSRALERLGPLATSTKSAPARPRREAARARPSRARARRRAR